MRGMLDKPSFQPRPCPICRKPSEAAYRPFCSKRCADIDLHRWLSGSYAVPAVERELDAEDMEDPNGEGARSAGHGGL